MISDAAKLVAVMVLLAACSASPRQMDSEELAAREVGNTGGLNYGEFGPPDAYEDESGHPYYGSENQWSRRMFEERAANLYYKRRGQRQMLEIIDGKPEVALQLADARLADDPADEESQFVRSVAFAQMGDLDKSWQAMQLALQSGMPFGRFLAGPRDLLEPLHRSARFQQFAGQQHAAIIHGPMLGDVTESSVRIWVRSSMQTDFTVRLKDGESSFEATSRTAPEADYTGVARVSGLQPNTVYSYDVWVDGEPATGRYHFRTPPLAGTAGVLQVGFGGCAGYTPENERVWDTIASHDLRAFLFLGDNVYIDVPATPGAFHEYSYYRRQSRPEFRRMVAAIPQYAIWDDHDAAFDDIWLGPYVDRPAWKQPMVESFRQNWNNPSYGSETHPGTWFSFVLGDVEFFMLDGRTYRTNPFIEGRSMLGPEQKAWLLEGLSKSTATFKVIASPVAWADGAKPGSIDTWSGFPEEREQLFSHIENQAVHGVILLSSDRHRSEAWRIERDSGYPFYELLSGQLTNIHTHPPEQGALFSYNAKDSFGVLTFDTDRADPQVTYEIRSIDNELIESLVVKLSELRQQESGGSK